MTSLRSPQDGYTRAGGYYQSLVEEALSTGADYAGLNCICGPSHMLELMRALDTEKYPLIAMPNSSYPSVVSGRTVYLTTQIIFLTCWSNYCQCGVRVLGGCCGTTPKHIRAAAEKLRKVTGSEKVEAPIRRVAGPGEGRADFLKKGKIVAAELCPPVDTDMTYVLGAAERLKACGSDYITVPGLAACQAARREHDDSR